MDPPSAGDRDNAFDFLRFSLATVVVFAHAFYVLGYRGVHVGILAVLGFFGISGFLVTQSWFRRRSVLDYARKRVLRIYPGFAAVVLLDHLVVAPLATGAGLSYLARVEPLEVLRDVVLLDHLAVHGVFRDLPIRAVNGSLWSVPYEFLCYTLLAVVGVAGLLRRRAVLALVAALWVVQIGLPPPGVSHRPGELHVIPLVLPFVTAFAVGAALRLRGARVEASPGRIAVVVALLAASLWNRRSMGLVWPIGLPYLLLWLAHHPRVPFRRWGRPGDFSYGLYLFHFPVQQLLVHVTGQRIGPLALFGVSMALTLPLAYASWHLVERPFLRLKDRRGAGAHSVDAETARSTG